MDRGGKILPLIVPPSQTGGTTLMNPSVYVDNGEVLVNIRHVNYVLYHCEGEERFYHKWGPLTYLNPENDITLTTTNFVTILNDKFEIGKVLKIDTSKLDVKPLWEFIGLEDIRLVRWDGKLYGSGVRRDTTTNGEGRIELSELVRDKNSIKEVSRLRLGIPKGETSYCEKNWMPILDMPYHYVKWCNPTQVVKVNVEDGSVETVHVGSFTMTDMPDLRGSSQVIRWGNHRMAMIHDVNLFRNKIGQKDADYSHRMIVWDLDWNIVHVTDPFKFMDGDIEFCCGMDLYNGNLLISFGFQDNASYLISIPEEHIEEIFNIKYLGFDWGPFKRESEFFTNVRREVFEKRIYDKLFEVKEGDTVVDIGASVGPYAYSIMERKPERVICLEPQNDLYKVCVKNLSEYPNVTIINKGISPNDGNTSFDNMFKPAEDGPGWWKQTEGQGITLKSLIKEYNLEKIDFLKIDCEGGEYDFFTEENYDWIKNNVKKIAAEIHIFDDGTKEKFLRFRDLYLKDMKFKAFSYDFKTNITDQIMKNGFENTWIYFMLYIDNTQCSSY